MNTHRSLPQLGRPWRSSIPQALRWLVVPLVVVATSIAVFGGVASAGIGAGAAPGFPGVATVGDTNVPGFIQIENRNSDQNVNDVNVVCNFGDAAPCPAGDPGITLIPSCGQLGFFSACNNAGADPGVFQLSATGTGVAGTACSGFVFDITLENAQFGRLRFTPRGGLNVQLAGVGAVCRIAFTFNVVRAPSIDQSPGMPGLQTVQIVDNTQYSQTTLTTASARGTSLPMTVNKAQPTIATTASAGIGLGGQLTDTAVVSGRVNPQPGATIDFRLYGPNDATCAGAPVFESLGVAYPVAGGPVTSAAFTPTSPGVYRWRATYNGDANNNPVAGACNDPNENATVAPANPTITTQASPNIDLGGQLTDTAIVSGRVSPLAGATVSFRLYGPDDDNCTGPVIFESLGIPYPAAGGPVTSAPFTPRAAGVYRWRAFYSGDANNGPLSGACNDPNENTVVLPLPLTLPVGALPETE